MGTGSQRRHPRSGNLPELHAVTQSSKATVSDDRAPQLNERAPDATLASGDIFYIQANCRSAQIGA